MTDIYNLPVTRYRTGEGKPTCSYNFQTNDYCVFLRNRGMCGKIECCAYCESDLVREPDSTGYLVPDVKCPLWKT